MSSAQKGAKSSTSRYRSFHPNSWRCRFQVQGGLAGETFGKTSSQSSATRLPEIEDVGFSLYTQLVSPVRWQDSIEYLRERGVTRIIEVGPGKVLSGLIRRIDRSLEVVSVEEIDDLEKLR